MEQFAKFGSEHVELPPFTSKYIVFHFLLLLFEYDML